MKKYIFPLIVLIAATGITFSQDVYQIRQAMDFFRANKMQSNDWLRTLSESEVEGTPYLNDEFINGIIFTTSKTQFVDIPLRYNIYNEAIEFKTPEDQVQAMAAPEIVEKVEFGDYKMVYIPYSNTKKIFRGFFKVIEEGNASLYARPEVVFKKAEEPGAYKEAQPAKFVKKPDSFYLRVGDEQAWRVGNKKEVIQIFPDHKNEIAAFIKKSKIKTNKVEDLKKLVQYYNTFN